MIGLTFALTGVPPLVHEYVKPDAPPEPVAVNETDCPIQIVVADIGTTIGCPSTTVTVKLSVEHNPGYETIQV